MGAPQSVGGGIGRYHGGFEDMIPHSAGGTRQRGWSRQPLAVGVAILTIVVTIVAAAALRPVGLTEVLLLVLVEVVGVSLFAGRAIAAATAVLAVLAVNWFLVPPYGTFAIQSQENWVSLGVFLLLSVGASSLVESVLVSERAAAAAAAREAVMAEALRPDSASAADSLRGLPLRPGPGRGMAGRLRVGRAPPAERAARGMRPSPSETAFEIPVAPGFTIVGRGPEILGLNRDFANTLATAVVRAWESQELVTQQEHAARLVEIDRARATLLASVGHDLRTPLAGIRVTADALALSEDALSDADRAQLLDSLRQSAIHLDELLGAVLDSSRIEAGVVRVDERPDRPARSRHPGGSDLRLPAGAHRGPGSARHGHDRPGAARADRRQPARQRPGPHTGGSAGRDHVRHGPGRGNDQRGRPRTRNGHRVTRRRAATGTGWVC